MSDDIGTEPPSAFLRLQRRRKRRQERRAESVQASETTEPPEEATRRRDENRPESEYKSCTTGSGTSTGARSSTYQEGIIAKSHPSTNEPDPHKKTKHSVCDTTLHQGKPARDKSQSAPLEQEGSPSGACQTSAHTASATRVRDSAHNPESSTSRSSHNLSAPTPAGLEAGNSYTSSKSSAFAADGPPRDAEKHRGPPFAPSIPAEELITKHRTDEPMAGESASLIPGSFIGAVSSRPPQEITETSTEDGSANLTQGEPKSSPRTTVGPNLTQGNTHNRNTYSIVNNSKFFFYGSTPSLPFAGHDDEDEPEEHAQRSRSGRARGRWRASVFTFLRLRCYGFFLVVVLAMVLFAVYGASVFWAAVIAKFQSAVMSLLWLITFGNISSRGSHQAPGQHAYTTTTMTFVTPVQTPLPTPIFRSPETVLKAVDDLDHWVAQLAHAPDDLAYLVEKHGLSDESMKTQVGSIRQGWTDVLDALTAHDKSLQLTFKSTYKDLSRLLHEIESSAALDPNHQPSFFQGWCSSIRICTRQLSPREHLVEYFKRVDRLLSRIRKIHISFLAEWPREQLEDMLRSLSSTTCHLRDVIEPVGQRLPGTIKSSSDLGTIIIALASRGNLLYDIFQRAELKVKALRGFLEIIGEVNEVQAAELRSAKERLAFAEQASTLHIRAARNDIITAARNVHAAIEKLFVYTWSEEA
ncbi:hypothetical protein G7046_g5384 [Stylonectria norvegica]|nr:hypothetical protein G7046_g5384 [Stylonectria norvegica]